jgi:hypothetical protein
MSDPFEDVTVDEPVASIADLLSPSSMDQWAKCQVQYMFRKVENKIAPPSAALTYGKGVDTTFGWVYSEKYNDPNRETPPTDDVKDKFTTEWDELVREGVEFKEGDDPAKLRANGQLLSGIWRDTVAVDVEPARDPLPFVDCDTGKKGQERVEHDAGDFKVMGYLDLVAKHPDGSEVVVDNKTSGRKYRKEDYPAKSSQAQFYTLATGIPAFEFHVGVKNVKPYVQAVPVNVAAADHVAFLIRAAVTRRQIIHAIGTGDFLPNRGHTLCSKRWCGFWEDCVKRFGGSVAD